MEDMEEVIEVDIMVATGLTIQDGMITTHITVIGTTLTIMTTPIHHTITMNLTHMLLHLHQPTTITMDIHLN